MAIENFDPKEWSKQFLGNLEPGGHCICDGSRENGWQEIHVNPLCPVHGNATNVATECTCPTWPGTSNRIVTAAPNPLCPVHGDVRDTGIIELCDLCGRPLPTDTHWVHTECADAENARP